MATDDNDENKGEVLAFVKDVVGALTVNTGEDFNRRRDDQGDVLEDPVSTTLAVLLCWLCLPNRFALASWILACGGFVLLFWMANSE